MIYVISSAVIVLYLMSLPIKIKIKGGADLDSGQGNISFSAFYLPLFRANGLFESRSFLHGDLIVMQQKKKRKLSVDVDRKMFSDVLKILKRLDLSFLANLDVKDINLSISYGGEDAFTTTLLLGCAKIIFYSLTAAIKSNQRVQISEEFIPIYNMRAFKLDFHGIFSLSIADIIYGYLAGKIKKFKAKKQMRANMVQNQPANNPDAA